MIQGISKAERFAMLPEDYVLRKQLLLKDTKEELSLVISLIENNPYSSDLLEYVKEIQNQINDLGYFCILPRPESVNAIECYERTLNFLNTISEKDCISLSADQYNEIDIYDLLGEAICYHCNKTRDLLIQFMPNIEKVKEEFAEFEAEVKSGNVKDMEKEFGDMLFSLVNTARLYKIDPDAALERTNLKFIKRFNYLEEQTLAKGRSLHDMSLAEMDLIWEEAKKFDK